LPSKYKALNSTPTTAKKKKKKSPSKQDSKPRHGNIWSTANRVSRGKRLRDLPRMAKKTPG
jgi:hypothetical protein